MAQTVEGTSYYLPKTALRLTLLVEKTSYQPGEFAGYAQRYMKKNDVQLEPSTTYRLIDTKIATFALPDTAKRYTLTLEDLLEGRQFEDGVARCDFCLDVHAVTRELNAKNPIAVPKGCKVKPYQIPLGACQAKDVDNLYMAGRCISGEFLPQASYRITGAAVGMGAGVAEKIAELCKAKG